MTKSSAPSVVSKASSLWRWLALGVAVVVLWALFPPLRVVSLDEHGKAVTKHGDETVSFDPDVFVERFWSERLLPGLAAASDLDAIVADIVKDPAAARRLHGSKVGVGTTVYYFAAGKGKVVEVKGSRALVEVSGKRVALKLGPLFGNTVRDGCGLLSVNDVPGLDEFNAISAVLNQKVESAVQPIAREVATLGAEISFVGCAPAPEASDGDPILVLVPLRVEAVQ